MRLRNSLTQIDFRYDNASPLNIIDTVVYYDSVRILLGDESWHSLPGECQDPQNILCADNYIKTGNDTSDIYTFTIR